MICVRYGHCAFCLLKKLEGAHRLLPDPTTSNFMPLSRSKGQTSLLAKRGTR